MTDRFEIRWHGVGTAGSPALELTNTLDWRLRDEPVELLHSSVDLLRWSWSVEILTLAEARSLRKWTQEHPRLAARALESAIELREASAELFRAQVRGETAPPSALGTLELAYRACTGLRSLRQTGDGLGWQWSAKAPEIERIAGAVALDAVQLLTSPGRERIQQCADEQCGWFFLDTSRNRSRRWCSMRGCGNRSKVRNFYRRSAEAG